VAWCESIFCEYEYPRHIQANWFALFVKTTLSLRYGRGPCDSPHQGAGPQMILAVLDHGQQYAC
jgi:hypothetical protein